MYNPFHCVKSKDNPFGVKFIHSLLSYFCNSCTYSKHRVTLCTLTVLKPGYDQVLGGRFYLSPPIEVSSWADPEGETGKSQVIWVSIGNKQLDTTPLLWKKLPPPPLENVGPPLEPWKRIVNITDGPEPPPPPLPLKKIPGSAHGPLTIN